MEYYLDIKKEYRRSYTLYSAEIQHKGLGKYRVISAKDENILKNKAQVQFVIH